MIGTQLKEQLEPRIREYGVRRIAEETGIQPAQISRWFSDDGDLTTAQMEKICRVLNVRVTITGIRVKRKGEKP